MDGVGSRLGRASSRYGPTPVFTGPVRRWKRQWVHLSSSSTVTHNHHHNGGDNTQAVRLPRWTPVKSEEEPPRRKYRYTPIVVLEEKKKNAAKGADIESRASKTNLMTTRETTERDDVDKRAVVNTEETESQDKKGAARKPVNRNQMDLDLSLSGNDGDN